MIMYTVVRNPSRESGMYNTSWLDPQGTEEGKEEKE
jgi:hypothetical protein